MVRSGVRRRSLRLLLASAGAVALLAVAAPPRTMRTITIQGRRFRPDTVTISAGDTLLWVNADTAAHTVTMDSTELDSGDIAPGTRFRWIFRNKGRFKYHCEVHYNMHAVLVVK
jgi:plastocyanin